MSSSDEDEGLRYRGSTGSAPEPPKSRAYDGGKSKKKSAMKSSFVANNVKNYLPQILAAASQLEKLASLVMIVTGKASKVYNRLHKKIEQHNPDAIVKMVTGLVLMFFGGFFVTTVAVFEAFKQGGRDRLMKNMRKLREQAARVREANEADDALDEDGDGIADVLQISKDELAQRKLLVFIQACDPQVLSAALGAMYTALLAALATLRIQFARTVSIGEYLYKPCEKYVIPTLEDVFEEQEEYHRWYPVILSYICKSIGATIAWNIQSILSTVATSVKGGNMVIEGAADYTKSKGITYLTDGVLDDILVWVGVLMGIYFQLFVFTYLPGILKLVLFPLFTVEWILKHLISTVPV